jgi:sigma-B regulation protein RsbU (phosphoserine phosphatase)
MSAATSKLRTHAFTYFGFAALLFLSTTYFARSAFDRFDAIRHADEYPREPLYLGDGNWGAVGVEPEAEEAGAKFSNQVLAVEGRPIDGFVTYYGALRQARAGDVLQLQIRPYGGQARTVSIRLRPLSDTPNTTGAAAYGDFALKNVALPLVCLALGFWVTGVRINDRSAWLLLVVLLSFAASLGSPGARVEFGRDDFLQPLFVGFRAFFTLLAAPALMLFGLTFPTRLSLDRRYPWFTRIVPAYLVLVALLEAINVVLWTHHLAWARPFGRSVELLTGLEGDFGAAIQFIALVACVAALAWRTATTPRGDARRRLLMLDLGAAASVGALAVLLIAGRLEIRLPNWAPIPLLAMLLVFPVTMAYAVVVHRAMDVRVAIRQGLQYVLASGSVRALQIVLGTVIVVGATVLTARLNVPRRLAITAAAIASIVALQRLARHLRSWVDRRFFREAYEADAILSDLAVKVRTIVETGPLLETVTKRIAESLHVPRIVVLLNGNGAFRPAYALGYASAPAATISEESLTVKRLRKQPHALVQFDDQNSWVQSTEGVERESLEALSPELLLPLSLNETLLGIMSLGPKQSEEPFSRTDIRLLDSVAVQTGLALENGRLTAAITAEVAARAKYRRELEIAHDVQERLFPQEYPPVAGLDYAGACRPALGVGGDYYDFVPLTPTRLGVAIGDVSGKGMPAALLMATLRAFLRGQTIHHSESQPNDLTEVMTNLNALVFESSAANRYATFFYGEFDAVSRVLTYVNGGHNPPMLFRQSSHGAEVVRLDAGGPVIGLMETCSYRQGSVTLERGDVLVAYTDGVSESMNAADEEWGEERLTQAVRPHRSLPARALIDHVMKSADAFVAGAPQHDDMTLVVVRAI